jgi:hypothetical protein
LSERSIAAVPGPVLALLAIALALQIAAGTARPPPVARAEALPFPPPPEVARTVSLDEPIAAAQLLTLYLQAFDNQPGISIPFRDLDYHRVAAWLDTLLVLDRGAQYPLLMASHLYAQVPVEAKQRLMLDFVHRKFLEDPERRWRWLAHGAIMARHRLRDERLALAYAEDIARFARSAPGWARQMHIFILEDMGEVESATVLLGGLLATGEVTDPREIHFLTQRLVEMKGAEKSSQPPKN